jgi:hypothetical protein
MLGEKSLCEQLYLAKSSVRILGEQGHKHGQRSLVLTRRNGNNGKESRNLDSPAEGGLQSRRKTSVAVKEPLKLPFRDGIEMIESPEN